MNKDIMPLPKKIKEKKGITNLLKNVAVQYNFNSISIKKQLKSYGKKHNFVLKRTYNEDKAFIKLVLSEEIKELKRVDERVRAQGYVIDIDNAIEIKSFTEAGIFYGLQTLQQITGEKGRIRKMKIVDWPDMKMRGYHMTLGTKLPKYDDMKNLILTLASIKINFFMIEYDDKFPWEKHSVISHPDSYTKDQIRKLISFAKDNLWK